MLFPNVLAVVAVASTLVAGVPVQSGEHLIARGPPPRAPTWVDRFIAAITPAKSPAVLVQHNGRVQKLPGPPPQAQPHAGPKKPELMPLPQIIHGPLKKREPVVIPAGIKTMTSKKFWEGGANIDAKNAAIAAGPPRVYTKEKPVVVNTEKGSYPIYKDLKIKRDPLMIKGVNVWEGGLRASMSRIGAGFKRLGAEAKVGFAQAKEAALGPKVPKGAMPPPKVAATNGKLASVKTPDGKAAVFSRNTAVFRA